MSQSPPSKQVSVCLPFRPSPYVQVRHAQLLAQLHVSKGSYGEAATVLYALAMRKSGPGDLGVTLQQRLEHLRAAALQVLAL